MRSDWGLPKQWGELALGVCLVILGAIALSGCGRFGEKGDLDSLMKFAGGDTGCLNDMGPRFERYFEGDISQKEWEATWDCGLDSLKLFRKFVRGNGPDGAYSRTDLQTFVSRFLVTDKPVNERLISATFELKASVFGGDKETLTEAELDRFMKILEVGKTESTRLLPLFAQRARKPTTEGLLELGAGVDRAGQAVADALSSEGNPALTVATMQLLAEELAKLLGTTADPATARSLMAAKTLALGGSPDEIEGRVWSRVFRMAGGYGGLLVAAVSADANQMNGPNEIGRFYHELAGRVRPLLGLSFADHGGALPYSAFDQAIDALPEKWMKIDRGATKRFIRTFVTRFLRGSNADALEPKSVDQLFAMFDDWERLETRLARTYDGFGAGDVGVSLDQLVAALQKGQEWFDPQAKADVARLSYLALNFKPMFVAREKQMTFTGWTTYSHFDMSVFLLGRIVADWVIGAYSTAPQHDRLASKDVGKLFEELQEFLSAAHIIDASVPGLYLKRFREADLFMPFSNGDGWLDVDEATYYFPYLFSIGTLADRIVALLKDGCEGHGVDPYGIPWYDIACFRRVYFDNRAIFWDHFPEMTHYYNRLDAAGRRTLEVAMEKGARRFGYTNLPIGRYDIESFAGILHYLEALIARGDLDHSNTVDLNELMTLYPVFKNLLAEFGGIDPKQDWLLEAAFTYTVKKGEAPKKNFWGYADFATWLAFRPFWKIDADRMALYKVISVLAVPETPPALALEPGYASGQ